MTNEMKAAFRMGLLVLALALSVYTVLFLHTSRGGVTFIANVPFWQEVIWTDNIIEFVVVWAFYGLFWFLLRPSQTPDVTVAKQN